MGVEILIVNHSKKQYYAPEVFGESAKMELALTGYHGRALSLLLVSPTRFESEPPPKWLNVADDRRSLYCSWHNDQIAILLDWQNDFWEVSKSYRNIGLQLLALVYENFERGDLNTRAMSDERFSKMFRESASKYGDVNMKHFLKVHIDKES